MHTMRFIAAGLLLGCTGIIPLSATAEQFYAGVGVAQFTHKADFLGFSDKGTSTGYTIILGSQLNDYAALETRFGGTGSANVQGFAASFNTTFTSIMLKPQIPLNDSLRIYGLFGYTSGSSQASGNVVGTAQKASMSYGGGLEMRSGAWAGGIEWARYWNQVDAGSNILMTIDGIGANLSYHF